MPAEGAGVVDGDVGNGGDFICSALLTVLVQQCSCRAIARLLSPSISCNRRISAQRETFMSHSWNEHGVMHRTTCGTVRQAVPTRRHAVRPATAARKAPASTAYGRPDRKSTR